MVPMTSDRNVEKNTTGKPREVPADVQEKQDPDFSEGDFESALDRSTRRLEQASRRGRGSTRR